MTDTAGPGPASRGAPDSAAAIRSRLAMIASTGLALLRWGLAAFAIWAAFEWSDDAICAVINLSLVALPFLLLLGLTGRWVAALSGASAFALFLYGMGEVKFVYFYTRLIAADWHFVTEPSNWTIVRQYPRIYGVLGGFAFGAGLLAIDALLAGRRQRWRPGLAARAAMLVAAGSLVLFAAANRKHHDWEVFTDDATCGTAHRCGVATRLLYSLQMFEFDPPGHAGDPTLFLHREQTLAAAPGPEPSLARPPDILLWLHESTFDPRRYQLPGARFPNYRMFAPAPLTRTLGPLRVHTYGGKTWLSEFTVLTGLIPDDFGARRSLVFNATGPQTQTNLFRLLKGNGYRVVVLMPTFKRFYGAGRTYEAMGADEVYSLRDFREYDAIPGDEWDIAETPRMAEAALKIVARHRAGPDAAQPLFLYFLSVKEHAPYERRTPIAYGLHKAPIGHALKGRLSDYAARLVTLDDAVTTVERALLAHDAPPTLFAWFGDHQAYYEAASPPYRDRFPDPKHVTQFQVRANYPTGRVPRQPIMDLAFLPALLADLSGVERDTYFAALSAMRRLCDGQLNDCGETALVDSYKARVFGREVGLFAPE
jgi:hypothetical protein